MKRIKVVFGGLFVVLAFIIMFADAQIHLGQYSKPSMALTHGVHGGLSGPLNYVLTQAQIFALPFRGPKDAVEKLPYKLIDGVKEFHMTAEEIMWEYAEGKYVHAWALNGQVPGPEIRVNEGDKVRIIVQNNLPVPTTVHWHGLHVDNAADGVPGITQYPIEPGKTFVYEFNATPKGTRFYHSHGSDHMGSVTQMDMGMTGAFIVEDPDSNKTYDREYVYLLDEWRINPDGTNGALEGLGAAGGHAHEQATNYNILTVNGRIDPFIPPLIVKEGEKVLVRMINVGVQEIHPMHTHGHSFKVAAIDGYDIPEDQQVERDVITLNPAERYDIVIDANNPGSWMFHCHHLHHASAGMNFLFLYEGYEPCCTSMTNYDPKKHGGT